jgi:hypothetical protein
MAGPAGERGQELPGVQGAVAVAEERVQSLPGRSVLGGGQLRVQARTVSGGRIGQLHQLRVTLHHVQHPADPIPILGRGAADRRPDRGVTGVQQAS